MSTPVQKYMVLSFGYNDLVGLSGVNGLERIEQEIKQYNLYAILEICAKISITLLNRGMANPLGQAELLAGIFPNKEQRIRFYDKAKAIAAGSPWAIFNQQSIVTLVKMAFMHCDWDSGKSVIPENVELVGYWLLHINDECFAKESGSRIVLLSREHERERLREAMARYQFFHGSERLGYKIGRYRWIVDYFKTKKPHGIDIEKLFLDSTGDIPLEDYMTVCSSLLVKWVNISTKKVDLNQDWVTCTDVYFKNTKLSKESIERVISSIAMLPQEFKALYDESVNEILGGHDEFHYNFMPFVWKPLVWFQDKKCFICPSAEYLFDKVTEGIYRSIETNLRQKNQKKLRNTFAIAWGDAFEQYINACFKSAFKKDYFTGIVDSTTKQQEIDGIINSQSFVFMVETKSLHWPYKTIVSGKIAESNIATEQLFVKKGLAQIARCIRKVKDGQIVPKLDRSGKWFIPVLVVAETMPQDTYNRKLYEAIAERARSTASDIDVLPFIILTAEEVEILEAIAKDRGSNIAIQILAEYSHMYLRKNEIGLTPDAIGFKNYLYYRGFENPEKSTNNKRLLTRLVDVMDDVCMRAFGNPIKKRQKPKLH